MNHYILLIICTLLVSLVGGFILIPTIVKFCKEHNFYDHPNARKLHKCNVPRLGGVCFLPCMFVAFLLAILILSQDTTGYQVTMSLWSVLFCVALLIIYAIGLVDDLMELSAGLKFIAQIIAASLLPIGGLYINNLYGLGGIHEIPLYVGAPLTVFVIVFIDNAINLIDGIDGLSSGLALLSLCGFLFNFMHEGIYLYSMLIAGLIGVLIAFMYYNVLGKEGKNKIFMGDSGSLTIGFILGFLFVKFSMDNPNVKPFRHDSILLAYTLLIVPVFDVCRVILVRFIHHKPIFGADKNHIHHKLIRTGLTQHQALGVILATALVFIGVNLLMSLWCNINYIVTADIALWIGLQVVIDRFIHRNGQKVFC